MFLKIKIPPPFLLEGEGWCCGVRSSGARNSRCFRLDCGLLFSAEKVDGIGIVADAYYAPADEVRDVAPDSAPAADEPTARE